MANRKLIQICLQEVFTYGLADDGTMWSDHGGNVWMYQGKVPSYENPEVGRYYRDDSEVNEEAVEIEF